MELRHLEHFVAVAEEGSFTRAATRVHLVQSALSVSVRSLERELGAKLLERTTRRVELTDEGRALLPQARATLASAEAARDAVAAVQGGVRGTLRLGIMQSLSLVDLPMLLTRFHRERPAVRIEPRPATGGSRELARLVADGSLDVAFVSLPAGPPPGVRLIPLGTESLVLMSPLGHPLHERREVRVKELVGERFIDYPRGWGIRAAVDKLFAEAGAEREAVVEIADVPTVVALVRSGFGLAFIATSMLPGRPSRRALGLSSVRPDPVLTVALALPTGRPQSAACQAFTSLARAMSELAG